MPEGPEASFLANYIDTRFKNKKLTHFNIIKGRYINHGPPKNTNDFIKDLPLKCLGVNKKGKVIVFYFEKGWYLISKLGMSGWWYCLGDEPDWKPNSVNVVLQFGQIGHKDLIFSDFRNYGTITITQDNNLLNQELQKLAPDILDKTTTLKIYKIRLHEILSKTSLQKHLIEDLLVNQQQLLSGIGNYLKAEILYEARVSPLRQVGDITTNEWTKIFIVAKKKATEMFKILTSIPTTTSKTTNTTKTSKTSEKYMKYTKYMNAMKVYHCKHDPLGNPVVTHTTKTGRTTWWVPNLQK